MNKIIVTIVLGLLAATTVGYFYFSNLDTSMHGVSEEALIAEEGTLTLTAGENIKGKKSLNSLFKLGKSMECTFYFSSDGIRGEGTGFFADGNARVDSLYTGSNQSLTASYMITDAQNKVMYTWTLDDGLTQGFKIAIPEGVSENTGDASFMQVSTPPSEVVVTPETAVEYDCKPWNVDNSVFYPPIDVEFIDMTNIQMQME